MSCQHGNWDGQCEICDEIDAAWKAGEASGKRSAEHCTCPACLITHASDCAVHNMPAMPVGECNCGAAGAVKVPDGATEVLRKSISPDGHAVSIVFESQEKADRFHARLNEAMAMQQNYAATQEKAS